MIPDGTAIVGISATLIGSTLAALLPRALDNRRQLDLMTAIHAGVVLYYRLLSQAKAMVIDPRSPIFRNLDAERQRKYLAEYLGIVRDRHIGGHIAIEAIEKHSRRSSRATARAR